MNLKVSTISRKIFRIVVPYLHILILLKHFHSYRDLTNNITLIWFMQYEVAFKCLGLCQ